MHFFQELSVNLLWLLSFSVSVLLIFAALYVTSVLVRLPFVPRWKYNTDVALQENRARIAEDALRTLDRWYADAAARNTVLAGELAVSRLAYERLSLKTLGVPPG